MNKFLLLLLCSIGANCVAEEYPSTKKQLALGEDVVVSSFITAYSSAICKKEFKDFRSLIHPHVVEFYKNKQINLQDRKVDFITFLFLVATSRDFKIYRLVLENPSTIRYYISDITTYPLSFDLDSSSALFQIPKSDFKVLNIFYGDDPNNGATLPIIYDGKSAFMAIPSNMLDDQQKLYPENAN